MSPKESTIERSRMTLPELRIELKQKRAEAAALRIGLTMQKEKNRFLILHLSIMEVNLAWTT